MNDLAKPTHRISLTPLPRAIGTYSVYSPYSVPPAHATMTERDMFNRLAYADQVQRSDAGDIISATFRSNESSPQAFEPRVEEYETVSHRLWSVTVL